MDEAEGVFHRTDARDDQLSNELKRRQDRLAAIPDAKDLLKRCRASPTTRETVDRARREHPRAVRRADALALPPAAGG